MRNLTLSLVALVMSASVAMAAEADGRIRSVDKEKLTITLTDGNTYRLPSEVDVSAIIPGSDVVIAYEEIDGVRQITDMALPE